MLHNRTMLLDCLPRAIPSDLSRSLKRGDGSVRLQALALHPPWEPSALLLRDDFPARADRTVRLNCLPPSAMMIPSDLSLASKHGDGSMRLRALALLHLPWELSASDGDFPGRAEDSSFFRSRSNLIFH